MAIVRRFGPVKGAGVVIVEKPPEETMRAAALGVACLVGQFEKGTVSTLANPRLNRCPTKRDFRRKMGERVSFSTATDCAEDYYSLGQGAGELLAIRLTDGTDMSAGCDVHSQHTALCNDTLEAPQNLLRLTAPNSGSWGGRFRHESGTLASAGAVSGLNVTTGQSGYVVNEWAGALLTLEGVPSKTYTVVANTATVLVLATGSTAAADLAKAVAEDGSTSLDYHVQLQPATLDSGTKKGIRVMFKPPQELATVAGQIGGNFGMEVYVDDDLVAEYPTLSLHSGSKFFIDSLLNEDTSNFHLNSTTLHPAGSPVSRKIRPSNYYGAGISANGTSVTVEPFKVLSTSDVNARVIGATAPNQIAGQDEVPPHELLFTYATAGNEYTVTGATHTKNGVSYMDLGTLPMGGAGARTATWTAPYSGVNATITIHHIDTPANESTIRTAWCPVPQEAIGHKIYPDAVNHKHQGFKIASLNTAGSVVTVEAGDPSANFLAPVSAVATTTDGPAAGATINAGGETVSVRLDGRVALEVTLTAGAKTTANIVSEVNAALVASAHYGSLYASAMSVHTDGGKDHLRLTSPGIFSGMGSQSSATIVGSDNVHGVHTDATPVASYALGTGGVHDHGTDGDEVEIRYPQLLGDGFDGGAVNDTTFVEALSSTGTPLLQLKDLGVGVVQIATPGVSATAVQKQGLVCAEALNYMYHVTVPAATTDEAAAVAFINETIGRSDFGCCYFPSFAAVPDPDVDGSTKNIPITGMILGRDALYARNFGGYHRPAAGIDATLPRIVDLPTGEISLNEELLNPNGLNVIKKKMGNFVIYGGRTISKSTGFQFRTHRLQMSHYEHTFLDSFDFVIFMLNNLETRAQLQSIFKSYFMQEFAKGVVVGQDLDDAVRIKIDDDNNPASSVAAGDLNAEIMIRLVNFVERFVITIGKQGIFEGTT